MTQEFEDTALADLDHMLLAWGGDAARWPEEVRTRIDSIARSHPAAKEIIAQAKALDRLLDAARDTPARLSSHKSEQLASRILAAVQAAAPVEAVPPAAVAPTSAPRGHPAPRRDSRDNVVALALRSQPPARKGSPIGWQAAGLIAASLLAGVYLGGSLNTLPLLQEIAEAVGITNVVDPSIAALGDDLSDEDTL